MCGRYSNQHNHKLIFRTLNKPFASYSSNSLEKKMSFIVYYLILHLCVSMHACNSRHLGVFHKEPDKEVDATSKKSETMTGLEGRNINENNMENKEAKFEFHSEEQNTHKGRDFMMFGGSDINVQISQEGTKIEGWKNIYVRSTMESKQKDSKEKIYNSKDGSVTEDVGVMDYAQPHRKPPIHNLQP